MQPRACWSGYANFATILFWPLFMDLGFIELLNLRKLLLPESSIVNDTPGALIAINRDDGDN